MKLPKLFFIKMGAIASKDTRRISFDNTFALNPALNVQNSIEDESIDNIIDLGSTISIENTEELMFEDNNKTLVPKEETDSDYWAQRLETLKNEHLAINKIIATEYEKTVEKARKLYDVPSVTEDRLQKVRHCFDWRSKILQCYEDNPHQPLVCSGVVQAFSKCVASCRVED